MNLTYDSPIYGAPIYDSSIYDSSTLLHIRISGAIITSNCSLEQWYFILGIYI